MEIEPAEVAAPQRPNLQITQNPEFQLVASGGFKLNDPHSSERPPPYFRFSESEIWEIWKSDMFRLPAAGGENFAVLEPQECDF